MNIFHVCYKPELSKAGKERIEHLVLCSHSNADTAQYEIDQAIDALAEELSFDNDVEYLNKLCVDHKIDYIEF